MLSITVFLELILAAWPVMIICIKYQNNLEKFMKSIVSSCFFIHAMDVKLLVFDE